MGELLKQGDQEIAASHLKANNTYGRNGAQNASSDLPGQKTASGFLPATDLSGATIANTSRRIDTSPIAPAHGMKGAAPGPKLGSPRNLPTKKFSRPS